MSDMEQRDLGTQPLDNILTSWGLSNHILVESSPEQLSHKQVVRARNGRRLTLKMMMKVARTVNFAIFGRLSDEEREKFTEYFPKHLFTYSKGHTEGEAAPNTSIYQNLSDQDLRKDFKDQLGL